MKGPGVWSHRSGWDVRSVCRVERMPDDRSLVAARHKEDDVTCSVDDWERDRDAVRVDLRDPVGNDGALGLVQGGCPWKQRCGMAVQSETQQGRRRRLGTVPGSASSRRRTTRRQAAARTRPSGLGGPGLEGFEPWTGRPRWPGRSYCRHGSAAPNARRSRRPPRKRIRSA